MGSAEAPVRADQAFRERAGETWVLLQEQTDAQLDPFGRAAIEKLGLTSGARILDVGCGCGQTLLELAELAGPSGHVVGVDVSEPMLARARQRVAGHSGIELCHANAQTHPFAADGFDALFSRFGVMFFEDARAAFANLRRALRPTGRMAFVCWQAPSDNPWAELPLRAVMKVLGTNELPELIRPGCPGPFYFSDPERVRAILSDAGFSSIEIERFATPLNVGGAMTLAEATAYCRQIGPAARAMTDAPATLRPALEAAIASALAPFVSERGVWMKAAAFIVTASVRA
ncbi:MAG TPA: methyltransferase domain-containing protein [Polyangia bacterium]|jgi:ubiquinone/menaquinone biosynthesis C-methylase UbiE